jgi:23S rRNA (cytosine1962-C5)-methyltransferase
VALSDLFRPFPLERVLFEDRDLVVIDKPADMSTHAPDAARFDDAVSRLSLAIAERDGVAAKDVYLGIHQRLDRDTSGVLMFTRRKSANAKVAAQFEGRQVKKTYVAAVAGWPARLAEGVLRHRLVPAEDGRMRCLEEGDQRRGDRRGDRRGRSGAGTGARGGPGERGQEAITHFRVVRRVGGRALLELRPETGRTHQLRVQIAAMGASIAGDRMYGREPFRRLLLHASSLAMKHPATDAPMRWAAPLPPEFEPWLEGEGAAVLPRDDAEIDRRLRIAIESRWGFGRDPSTTAFRIVHGEADGFPGIAVDAYGDFLLLHLFSTEADAARENLLDRLAALGAAGVYVMRHPKQSSTLVDTRTEALAPRHAQRGEDAPERLVVRENELSYLVRLGDGLKTGIFLDQRENRRRVRDLARGKRVLNLFAYTCGFTVAAAAGGAERTVSVDSARGVLGWGEQNLALNGLERGTHQFVDDDVFTWIKRARKRDERFDLVILDPPSFATTHASRFSAESDYADLASLVLSLVAPGGFLLACTNHRGVGWRKFRKQLHEAGRRAGRELAQVKDLPEPRDFPAPFGEESHLKSLLVTVAK